MKQKWLNFLLFLSGKIYALKQKNLSAGTLEFVKNSVSIFLLKILNFLLSLPFYFFIAPLDSDSFFGKGHKDLRVYRLRRRITIAMVGLFLLFEVVKFSVELFVITGLPNQTQAFNYSMTASGTYVGNGSDDRAITGIGFQPDVVIVDGDASSNTSAVIRTSTMNGDISKVLDTAVNTFGANFIQSLDANGFTIGDNANVNTNGVTYYWTAFKAAPGSMTMGSYVGNGVNGNTVTGLGFQPDYLIILPGNNTGWAMQASSAMASGIAVAFSGDNGSTGRVNSLASPSNGFTLGASSSTNSNGVTYYYVAWKEVAGRMDVGSYAGNATDNRDITGIGFQPAVVMVKGRDYNNGMMRTSSMSGDFSLDIPPQGNPKIDAIQALQSDGFQVGTSGRVNSNSVTYYYAAFVGSIPSTFTQSGYRVYENMNATDVGSALGAQDSGVSLGAVGGAFRVRMLLHVGTDQLPKNGESFKLQYVDKGSGTCASPSGGVPATYTDVTSSTLLAYQDNGAPTDGAPLTANANDPVHSGHTTVPQTYEETNTFTNAQAAIPAGQDGMWDMSLYDNSAPAGTTYCLRMVKIDGTELTSYSVYPEITIASGDTTGPSVTNVTSSTVDGTYGLGSQLFINVVFDEIVTVTGAPQLTLETGGTDAVAQYTSGSGTDTLTFTYTVGAGEVTSDLDYVATNALVGTLADSLGNAATLTLPEPGQAGSLGANKAIVIDTTGPSVTNVTSSTADGTYGIGAQILINVSFDDVVTVGGANTPSLALETGDMDAVAQYTNGSGTNTLVFTYTVGAGENAADLDYTATTALSLNGATLTDNLNNNVDVTLPNPGELGSLGANKNIEINTDVTGPIITNVTSSKPDGTYGTNEAIPIQLAFDETVTVTGTPVLTLETGDTDRVAMYTSGSGTNTLTFTYTVMEGDMSSDLEYQSVESLILDVGSTIKDRTNNNATLTLPMPGAAFSLSDNKALVIDTTPPDTTAPTIMNITSSTADGAYGAGAVISIQVEFSEVVTIGGSPELWLNTGGSAVYSGGVGSIHTFSYTVGDGENTDDLDYSGTGAFASNGAIIRDSAGNDADVILSGPGDDGSLGANKELRVDTTNPILTNVTSSTGDGIYDVGDEILIQMEFDEIVMVTGMPSLVLETGETDVVALYTSGSGTNTLTFTYTVGVGELSGDLDYVSSEALGLEGATLTDSAGNAADLMLPSPGQAGSLGANKTLVIDTVAPNAVTLTFSEATATSLKVSWIAPGDNGATGTATTYDLRYATTEITDDASFTAATAVSNEPVPQVAGSEETLVLSGLAPETTYYVALKTSDSAGHTSALSNVPSLRTLAAPEEPEEPVDLPQQVSGYSSGRDILSPSNFVSSSGDDELEKSLAEETLDETIQITETSEAPEENEQEPDTSSESSNDMVAYSGTNDGVDDILESDSALQQQCPVSIPNLDLCQGQDRTQFPFTDVDNHWALDFVEDEYQQCVVSGRTPTLFAPDGTATRAEFVRMVARSYRLGESQYFRLFSDVNPGDWFAPDVIQTAKIGVVSGYENPFSLPYFRPDRPITRAEALVILARAECISLEGYTESFADVNEEDWFHDVVAFAQQNNIVQGYQEIENGVAVTYFKPHQLITRAEALKMMSLFQDLKQNRQF